MTSNCVPKRTGDHWVKSEDLHKAEKSLGWLTVWQSAHQSDV